MNTRMVRKTTRRRALMIVAGTRKEKLKKERKEM
jgi:hypothetical protein